MRQFRAHRDFRVRGDLQPFDDILEDLSLREAKTFLLGVIAPHLPVDHLRGGWSLELEVAKSSPHLRIVVSNCVPDFTLSDHW